MPDHNEPKPLKHPNRIWITWLDKNGNWIKWHCFDSEYVIKFGLFGTDPICHDIICYNTDDIEFTADTPPPGDCCKRCTERMEQ